MRLAFRPDKKRVGLFIAFWTLIPFPAFSGQTIGLVSFLWPYLFIYIILGGIVGELQLSSFASYLGVISVIGVPLASYLMASFSIFMMDNHVAKNLHGRIYTGVIGGLLFLGIWLAIYFWFFSLTGTH